MAQAKNSNGNMVINDTIELLPDAGQSIEAVVSANFKREVFEEAFMNEYVTILVAESADDNVNQIPTPSVNGVMQPILRGHNTRVKRKYVEVLARCKETKYSQNRSNPMEPERIDMVSRSALAYPFHVVEDKNPVGAAWLSAVMLEA